MNSVNKEQRGRILLVEDSEVVLETLHKALKKRGFEVYCDSDGTHAVSLAQERCPDLCLIDIKLPGRDGMDILREMKENSSLKDIPALMLTNLTDQRLVSEAVELGARGYFVKSEFSFDEIIQKVEEILR